MRSSPRLSFWAGSSVLLGLSNAFVPTTRQLQSSFGTTELSCPHILRASVKKDVKDELPELQHAKEAFPEAQFHSFEMADHRPLGCTVEESLDINDSYVFVSKVVPGGFADQAGIQVGDVVVAVTGLFGEVTPVLESGIEKIKGLVGAVPEEDPLIMHMARGSGVLERHESAVVDLCQSPGASDKEVENCVTDFLASGYSDPTSGDDDEEEQLCDDADEECLIDNMMNLWADELPPPPTTSGITDQPGEGSAKKAKPWSSRSSPSGTYVRDPVTGQMRNIDETDWK